MAQVCPKSFFVPLGQRQYVSDDIGSASEIRGLLASRYFSAFCWPRHSRKEEAQRGSLASEADRRTSSKLVQVSCQLAVMVMQGYPSGIRGEKREVMIGKSSRWPFFAKKRPEPKPEVDVDTPKRSKKEVEMS